MSEFVCGGGCFMVSVSKSSSKSGFSVRLLFSIGQDKCDSILRSKLVDYLSCGSWYAKYYKTYGEYVVSKFSGLVVCLQKLSLPFIQ